MEVLIIYNYLIMRKLAIFVLAMAASSVMLLAQSREPARLYVSLQGGAMYSINENHFTYRENGKPLGLITPHGAVAVGFDITPRFGSRLSVSYGNNASACNSYNTAGRGFYPYTFQSINAFIDVILNLRHPSVKFLPKLYAGIGEGYTFGFSDPGHPWQKLHSGNVTLGLRGGFIGQYNFTEHIGAFFDICGEAYTDTYNGLQPSADDQNASKGYAGFPFDLRGLVSLGAVYKF